MLFSSDRGRRWRGQCIGLRGAVDRLRAEVENLALIEDKTLDITLTAHGGLVGVQDFTSGVGELRVPIVLRNFGPRNVYLTLDGSSSWSRCWEPT